MARHAFVMGSNGPAALGKLQYAASDATKVAKHLRASTCGFSVRMPRRSDSPSAVEHALARIALECKPQDTFICYYSGHGLLEGGELFLPWQEKEDNLLLGSLRLPNILQTLRHCPANNKLLILDCCHAGAAAGTRAAPMPMQELLPPENHLVLVASPRLETAREWQHLGGGFLTAKLCDALSDSFASADKDGDSNISVSDMKLWLEESAVEHNLKFSEKVPVPFLFGQLKGSFLFAESKPWSVHELRWPDDSTLVVIPAKDKEYALALGRFPITNAQYARYARDRNKQSPVGRALQLPLIPEAELVWKEDFRPWDEPDFQSPDHPVVCVSYPDAAGYCGWVNQLPRSSAILKSAVTFIPSPEVWTFAAYGTSTVGRPASPLFKSSPCVHHMGSCPKPLDPAGLRTNSLGIADLIGNVWEWNAGRAFKNLSVAMFYRDAPEIRGGGFADDVFSKDLVLHSRDLPGKADTRHFDLGFRIAARIRVSALPKSIRKALKAQPKFPIDFESLVS